MIDENVRRKIESYPDKVSAFAILIRELIYKTAEAEGTNILEESLKWGEPSYKAPNGTPIRMDWKEDSSDKFYIFFNCKTVLIETYKTIYGTRLFFEGNRAIVLNLSDELPREILQHCFSLALKYHSLKKLPLLGA